jgi:hypothetical protein
LNKCVDKLFLVKEKQVEEEMFVIKTGITKIEFSDKCGADYSWVSMLSKHLEYCQWKEN